MAKGWFSRPEVRAFAILLVVSAFIGQAQRAAGTKGASGLIANALAGAARPGHRAVAEGRQVLADLGGLVTGQNESRAEEEALSVEVLRLRSELARLEGLEAENKRLREMLAFSRETDLDLTAADVLGGSASPWFQSIIIDLGSSDGIKPGMAVASYSGLVGQVFRVQSKTADVCLVTDPDSSVSVLDSRSGALGIVRGTNGRRLRLTYLSPDADVQRGDEVLTSGVGGVYPRGLSVGTVTGLSYDAHLGVASAEIEPAADLRNPKQVFVCSGAGGG